MTSTDEGMAGLDTFIVLTNIITIIIGVIGNVSASAIILCNKSMYTITNFYLLSLSISDLLILTLGPVQYIMVYFNPDNIMYNNDNLVRSLLCTWLIQTSINASILTMTAFTVERFLAICFPFLARSLSTKSRVIKIIITIWLVGTLLALIPTVEDFIQAQSTTRDVKETTAKATLYLADLLAILYFFIPMTVITIMYILIGIKLRARSRMCQTSTLSDRNTAKSLKMFVLIVSAFILCWAPFYISKILWLHILMASDGNGGLSYTIIWYLSLIKLALYPLSPAINPIIYTVMSKKFRDSYKNLLKNLNCFINAEKQEISLHPAASAKV